MPLQTFYNLDDERKYKILIISYEEFVFNSYKTASVSNIVKRLKLAKGSFYRYFENKLDLYTYLVHRAYNLRMKQLETLKENPSFGFFDIIRENFRKKIIFDIQYPLESILLFNLFQEIDSEEVKHLYNDLKSEALNITRELIVQFQQEGSINEFADPEIAALFIFQSQLGIYEYMQFFKGVDFKKNIREGKKVFELAEEQIMEIVDKFLMAIMLGLEKRK
jgi:AcrR family transcriptional regulator